MVGFDLFFSYNLSVCIPFSVENDTLEIMLENESAEQESFPFSSRDLRCNLIFLPYFLLSHTGDEGMHTVFI